MTAALSCHGLVVTLGGQRVLDGVSVEVEQGEWLAVVGPNGAGKTTMLRVVTGAQPPDAGAVTIAGREANTLRGPERARAVALVAQTPVAPPGMTVAQYVLLGRTPHLARFGTERAADVAATEEALGLLALGDFVERELTTLSGGERQRAYLARALAQAAPLVLLDEPTTALDVGHQQDVLELVDHLRSSRNLTVVSTMHDLTLAGQYANRLLLLDRGRVIAHGGAAEVLTPQVLARHYGARVQVIRGPGGGPVVVPLRLPKVRGAAVDDEHRAEEAP